MRRNITWILVLVFTVTSCNSFPATPDPGSTINGKSTATAIPKSIPTPTVEDSTALQTPVLSNRFEQKCIEYDNQGFKSQGFLLLNMGIPLPVNQEQNILIVNLNNGTSTSFDGSAFSVPTVYNISPSGKWYFYLRTENTGNQLHINSIDWQEKLVLYWDKNWGENIKFMSWLDDEHLSILKFPSEGPRTPFIVILNPFTGEWRTLEPNFPSGQNNDIPLVYVDPSLSKAIYISGNSYVLWDVETGRDIWRKRGVNFTMLPRGWSPDGTKFAFVSTNKGTGTLSSEIYSVDRDGQETQLTDLSGAFPLAKEIYILGMEWSPNSKYIAFSFLVKDDKESNFLNSPSLALVDIENKKTINLCIPVSQYAGEIVWSPFSDQVAVTSTTSFDTTEMNVVIVDIKHSVAYNLYNNATTLGWMIVP
jgi:hypothetical protein